MTEENGNVAQPAVTEPDYVVKFVDKIVKVPKELNDCYVCLDKLMEDIAAKKNVAEISAGSLKNLMAAFSGAQEIPKEVKAALKESIDGGLLMSNSMCFRFLGK